MKISKEENLYEVHFFTKEIAAPTPLLVWTYDALNNGKARPVTGDYDLWLVAPHMDTPLETRHKKDHAGWDEEKRL
jgi:hypothetical protein